MKLPSLTVKAQFLPEFLHWYIYDGAAEGQFAVRLSALDQALNQVEVSRKGAKKGKA